MTKDSGKLKEVDEVYMLPSNVRVADVGLLSFSLKNCIQILGAAISGITNNTQIGGPYNQFAMSFALPSLEHTLMQSSPLDSSLQMKIFEEPIHRCSVMTNPYSFISMKYSLGNEKG